MSRVGPHIQEKIRISNCRIKLRQDQSGQDTLFGNTFKKNNRNNSSNYSKMNKSYRTQY